MYTTLTSPIAVDIDTREIRRYSLCLAPLLHLLRGPHGIDRLYKGAHDEIFNREGMGIKFVKDPFSIEMFRAGT
jgi:hypothetical protein